MREGPQVLQNHIREFDGCGPLHLSGHGNYNDHVKFIGLIKPKFYMPIHGEFHMLVHNAELAHRTGIPKENIFVMDNGDVLELTAKEAARTKRIKSGSVMYDGAGALVSEVVIKDRIHMSTEGIFNVILTVDKKTGNLLTSPDIISRGFIYLRDSEELMAKIRRYLKQKVASFYKNGNSNRDVEELKKAIREDVAHILYDETERTPIVIAVVNEINGSK
jgi:ribonuclease J